MLVSTSNPNRDNNKQQTGISVGGDDNTSGSGTDSGTDSGSDTEILTTEGINDTNESKALTENFPSYRHQSDISDDDTKVDDDLNSKLDEVFFQPSYKLV